VDFSADLDWRTIRPKPVIVNFTDKVLKDPSKGSEFAEDLAVGMFFAADFVQYGDQQFAGQFMIFLAFHWVTPFYRANYRFISVKWKQEKAPRRKRVRHGAKTARSGLGGTLERAERRLRAYAYSH
jgi:hypothetical protein